MVWVKCTHCTKWLPHYPQSCASSLFIETQVWVFVLYSALVRTQIKRWYSQWNYSQWNHTFNFNTLHHFNLFVKHRIGKTLICPSILQNCLTFLKFSLRFMRKKPRELLCCFHLVALHSVQLFGVCLNRVWSSPGESDLHQTDDQHRPGGQGWKPSWRRHHFESTDHSTLISLSHLAQFFLNSGISGSLRGN